MITLLPKLCVLLQSHYCLKPINRYVCHWKLRGEVTSGKRAQRPRQPMQRRRTGKYVWLRAMTSLATRGRYIRPADHQAHIILREQIAQISTIQDGLSQPTSSPLVAGQPNHPTHATIEQRQLSRRRSSPTQGGKGQLNSIVVFYTHCRAYTVFSV